MISLFWNFYKTISAKYNFGHNLKLKLLEALLGTSALGNLQYVETYSFGDWSAFSNGGNVTDFNVSVN